MKSQPGFCKDTRGDAIVEATILFPIILMIFAGLVLLAIYLPTRMALQHTTQYAATALATEQSDTWLDFDTGSLQYKYYYGKGDLPNVYAAILASFLTNDVQDDAEIIVRKMDEKSITARSGKLEVECEIMNYLVYKEIKVTATRTVPMPVDLSFVKFPKEIPITVSSTAVVLNGDEFIRNMDLAVELIAYLDEKLNLHISDLTSTLGTWMGKVYEILGI